jgi:hypothetical protein
MVTWIQSSHSNNLDFWKVINTITWALCCYTLQMIMKWWIIFKRKLNSIWLKILNNTTCKLNSNLIKIKSIPLGYSWREIRHKLVHKVLKLFYHLHHSWLWFWEQNNLLKYLHEQKIKDQNINPTTHLFSKTLKLGAKPWVTCVLCFAHVYMSTMRSIYLMGYLKGTKGITQSLLKGLFRNFLN